MLQINKFKEIEIHQNAISEVFSQIRILFPMKKMNLERIA